MDVTLELIIREKPATLKRELEDVLQPYTHHKITKITFSVFTTLFAGKSMKTVRLMMRGVPSPSIVCDLADDLLFTFEETDAKDVTVIYQDPGAFSYRGRLNNWLPYIQYEERNTTWKEASK